MPTVITSESTPPNSFKAVIASSKANALSETGIAQAIASKGLTDAQARTVVGNASSIAVGLRNIGLDVSGEAPPYTPPPVFTTQPVISGTATVGQALSALTVTDGTVSGGNIANRVFMVGDAEKPSSYTLVTDDVGKLITYKNTAINSGGTTIATSNSVTVIAAGTTPTLTLTGPLSYRTNTVAGTTVANISNVPAGVTPTLTPNDGRLAIGGNSSSGWKVVVGSSASTVGTISITVAATGANSANANITVSAAIVAITGVIFAGDSITKGAFIYGANATPERFGTRTGLPIVNNGNDGAKIQRNIDTYQTEVVAKFGTGGLNMLLTTIGINDILTGATAAYVTGKIMELHALNRANSIPSWFGTLTPCGPSYSGNFNEAARLTVNQFIRDKVADGTFDGMIDYASDTRLQDPTNITYYSDQLHFTTVGYDTRADITQTGYGLGSASNPTVSLSSAVTQAEGNSGTTNFVWTLTLNRVGSTAAFPFTWAVTGNGSNPADANDFGGTFPSGSGTFASGETTKTITVPVTGDTAVEPNETFLLTVNTTGLNTVTSTGTITNDDSTAPPQPTVAFANPAPAGNTGTFAFSNNNRTIKGNTIGGGQPKATAITTVPISGKMLFAATLESRATNNEVNFALIGVNTATTSGNGTGFDGQGGALFTGIGQVFIGNADQPANIPTPVVGDTVGVFVDFDAAKMWFYLNGTWYGLGRPLTLTTEQVSAGTSGINISGPKSQGTLYFACGERDQTGFQWTMLTAWPFGAGTKPTGSVYIGE